MPTTGLYFRLAALVSVVFILAACPLFLDDSSSSGDNNPVGSLRIDAGGLPGVSLRGGGAVRLSSSGETIEIPTDALAGGPAENALENIHPGTYTVTVYPVRGEHEIVDTIFDPVSAPAEVVIAAGERRDLTLEFAPRPGTGSLWVSSGADKRLVQYAASELTGSGEPVAALDFDLSSAPMNQDLVFRSDGAIWLVRYTAPGELNVFHPAQWAGLGTGHGLPDPATTFVNADGLLSGSTSIAIDGDDTVFVAQYNEGGLIRFDGLAATEPDPTNPVVVNLSPDGIFDTSGDIFLFNSARFDPEGNLWIGTWVVDLTENTQALLRFSRGDLYQNGNHTIAPSLAGDFDAPLTVEFDAAGRLWVTVYGPGDYTGDPEGRLLRFDDPNGLTDGFTANDADLVLEVLAASGDPIVPVGIAFDNSGYLWTYDYDHADGGSGRMVRIDVTSVPEGATTVTATAVVTGTPPAEADDWGTFLAFNPPPPGQ